MKSPPEDDSKGPVPLKFLAPGCQEFSSLRNGSICYYARPSTSFDRLRTGAQGRQVALRIQICNLICHGEPVEPFLPGATQKSAFPRRPLKFPACSPIKIAHPYRLVSTDFLFFRRKVRSLLILLTNGRRRDTLLRRKQSGSAPCGAGLMTFARGHIPSGPYPPTKDIAGMQTLPVSRGVPW